MFKRHTSQPEPPAAPDLERLQRKNAELLGELKRERRIRRALELTVETLQRRQER